MIVLAIDTSGPVAGVAIARDSHVLYEAIADLGKTHSQSIMPMVDQAMDMAGLAPAQVDLFACVAGPGSFTGVRIGVCAVQALAEATGKKCVALDALHVLAEAHSDFDGTLCPILDARRGQVYAAAFRAHGGRVARVMDDCALPLEAYLAQLPEAGRLLFVGDGVAVHAEAIARALGERAVIAAHFAARIMPGAACALALEKQSSAVDAAQLLPIYLRKPQAEREREARLHG